MVTYSCDAASTGSGEFVRNTINSLRHSSSWFFLPQCFNMLRMALSFVAVVRDAVTASSLAGTVITWKTVSRSGRARTYFFDDCRVACFQESQSNWLLCLLVTRQEKLSLCIREYEIMKYRWRCLQCCRRRDGGWCSLGFGYACC